MTRRNAITAAITAIALLTPLAACQKAARSVTDIETENSGGPKPSYPDLVRVEPDVDGIIDRAPDGKAATEAVLGYVSTQLGHAGDESTMAYGKLLQTRIANAKAHHPEDCAGVVHGDNDAIDRNADARAEHAWMLEALHPTQHGIIISKVVIGASLPSASAYHPHPGESACDVAKGTIDAITAQPTPVAAAGLRTLGLTVGSKAL